MQLSRAIVVATTLTLISTGIGYGGMSAPVRPPDGFPEPVFLAPVAAEFTTVTVHQHPTAAFPIEVAEEGEKAAEADRPDRRRDVPFRPLGMQAHRGGIEFVYR